MRILLLLVISINLTGCAIIVTSAGGGAAAVQTATILDAAKLTGDVVSGATTGKSLTDNVISYAFDQDCSLLYPLGGYDICNDEVGDVTQ